MGRGKPYEQNLFRHSQKCSIGLARILSTYLLTRLLTRLLTQANSLIYNIIRLIRTTLHISVCFDGSTRACVAHQRVYELGATLRSGAMVPSTFGAILARSWDATSRRSRSTHHADQRGRGRRPQHDPCLRPPCLRRQSIVLVIAQGEDERTATLTPRRALQLSRDLLEAACRELDGDAGVAPSASCSDV
jgi:hypothetical protein